MKAARDFIMGFQPVQTATSFTPPEIRVAQPLEAQNNNEKPQNANIAELGGANFLQNMVVDTVFPGLGLVMSAMNNAQFAASAVDLHNESKTQAPQDAQRAAIRTQQASFTPAMQSNDFSTRSFGINKKNDFQISFSRPSDMDGSLSKGIDLSAPIASSSFKPQTLGR